MTPTITDFSGRRFSKSTTRIGTTITARPVINPELDAVHPLHSPYFTMDENVLPTAAAVMAKAAMDYLNQ